MKKAIPFLLGLFLLSGCFMLPVEEPVLQPPIIKSVESKVYKTVPVKRGTVESYRDLSVSYVPAREEKLFFTQVGVYIKDIPVQVGDSVRKGDIVAELDREYFQQELEVARREETRVRMSLSQLEDRYALYRKEAAISGKSFDEAAYMDERMSLQTQLESILIRTDYLRREDESRIVYATMDGTITYVRAFKEGDITEDQSRRRGARDTQHVVTITDQTLSVFVLSGSDSALVKPGDRYTLSVNWDPYEAEVVDPAEMGITEGTENKAYFVIVDEEHPQYITQVFATLHLVTQESTDVLYLPNSCIRKAAGRVFVYVLVDGVRELRDIEIGHEGNIQTEIVSGLQENEIVISD